MASTGYGALLAALILYVLSQALSKDSILAWGWRLPFLLGGGLAVASYFIRRKLQETPAFLAVKNSKMQAVSHRPFSLLLRTKKREVFFGIGLTFFVAALVVFALYLPAFLSLYGGFKDGDIYLALMIGILWCSVSLPFWGLLGDRVGCFRLYLSSVVSFLALAIPMFSLLESRQFGHLVLFLVLFETFLAWMMASYFFVLSSLFPTATRYTGIAFCYNTVYAVMGASPIFMTWTVHQAGPIAACRFLMGCAVVSLLVALYGMRCKAFSRDRS